MIVAVDINNNRIKPKKKLKGFCQFCGNIVIAACGDINVNHWRHENKSLCNYSKENETIWHRNWKNEFPFEYQERLIIKNNTKHIADVQLKTGLVIEFQNSPISISEIKKRELFYDKMIWVINGIDFKQNLHLHSKAKIELNKFNQLNLDNTVTYYSGEDENETLDKLKLEHENLTQKYYSIEEQINNKITTLNEFSLYLEEIDHYCNLLVEKEYKNIPNTLKNIPLKSFDKLKDLYKEKKELVTSITNIETEINSIEKLPKITIDYLSDYIKYSFSQTKTKDYKQCKLVEIKSKHSLFPKVITFNSESDFNYHKNRNDNNYELYFTPSEVLLKKLQNTLVLKEKIEKKKQEIEYVKTTIKKDLISSLKNLKTNLSDEINRLRNESDKIKSKGEVVEEKIELEEINYIKFLDKAQKEYKLKEIRNEEEIKKKRNTIIYNNNNLYNLYWLYRRKSWDESDKRKFIDIGSYLIEIIDSNTAKKHSKKAFLKAIYNY